MRSSTQSGLSNLLHLGGIALLFVVMMLGGAHAHVTLGDNSAAPGSHYAAHFRVGHGCNGSPTIALTVEIPPGIGQVSPQASPGWSIATVREGTRVTAVTWKGGQLAADKPGEFIVTMLLPAIPGPLVFPATQVCKNGEERWDELPGAVKQHPAPMLMLASAPVASGLAVSDGWFRALPAGLPAGGYFVLRNASAKKAVLTGAQSPGCGTLMLHKSEDAGGMSAMTMVGSIDVAAGSSVAFSPGGYHLMCMDAKPAIKPGAKIPVTLLFQDGSKLTADFAVRNAAGK